MIVVPTRELALQTSQICVELSKHLKLKVSSIKNQSFEPSTYLLDLNFSVASSAKNQNFDRPKLSIISPFKNPKFWATDLDILSFHQSKLEILCHLNLYFDNQILLPGHGDHRRDRSARWHFASEWSGAYGCRNTGPYPGPDGEGGSQCVAVQNNRAWRGWTMDNFRVFIPDKFRVS